MALRALKLSDECINECLSALREREDWWEEDLEISCRYGEELSNARDRLAAIRAAHAELLKAQAGQ